LDFACGCGHRGDVSVGVGQGVAGGAFGSLLDQAGGALEVAGQGIAFGVGVERGVVAQVSVVGRLDSRAFSADGATAEAVVGIGDFLAFVVDAGQLVEGVPFVGRGLSAFGGFDQAPGFVVFVGRAVGGFGGLIQRVEFVGGGPK
jgi:hypothetical protein